VTTGSSAVSLAFGLVLTLASGWLYGLSFPTARVQALAWVALVPLLVALRGASLRRALLLGWVWTVMAAYAVGDWFARSVATYYEQPILVGVGFFIGVSSLMAAPFYMAFAACYRVLVRRPGAPKFSAQQFDIVRLRTVEQRRYLVRASTSGPSAIVDPLGRVAVQTRFLTQDAIGGRIFPRTDVTPYARVGDLFALGCLVTAVAAASRCARRTSGLS